jgi:iodotyrosine deiodinase
MQKIIDGHPYIPHSLPQYTLEERKNRTAAFYKLLDGRRSIRHFTDEPIHKSIIENIIKSASTAPSGAHKQPWTFCVISDPEIKKQIRIAAEEEEKKSYEGRMSEEWLQDLAPLGTNWQKPFLEIAPYLIIVFKRSYELDADGHKHQNYYVQESVGLACGMLLAAINNAGLGSLTHTPSPMNFLCKILNRPENEKPFLLVPVGHLAADCYVPDIHRKSLNEMSVWY